MQLSDLIVTVELRRLNGEIALCNLLRRTCHILQRRCDGLCDLVEQYTEDNEGEQQPRDHCPFEVVHIGEYFVFWNEKYKRPPRAADWMHGVVILYARIGVGEENWLFREEAACVFLILTVDIVLKPKRRVVDEAFLTLISFLHLF